MFTFVETKCHGSGIAKSPILGFPSDDHLASRRLFLHFILILFWFLTGELAWRFIWRVVNYCNSQFYHFSFGGFLKHLSLACWYNLVIDLPPPWGGNLLSPPVFKSIHPIPPCTQSLFIPSLSRELFELYSFPGTVFCAGERTVNVQSLSLWRT